MPRRFRGARSGGHGSVCAPAGACRSAPLAAARGCDTEQGPGGAQHRGHRAPRPRPRGRRLCPPAPPALTGGRCGGRGAAGPASHDRGRDGRRAARGHGHGYGHGRRYGGCGWRGRAGRRSVLPARGAHRPPRPPKPAGAPLSSPLRPGSGTLGAEGVPPVPSCGGAAAALGLPARWWPRWWPRWPQELSSPQPLRGAGARCQPVPWGHGRALGAGWAGLAPCPLRSRSGRGSGGPRASPRAEPHPAGRAPNAAVLLGLG